MRIGKLEYIETIENAETSENLIQLIQSEKHRHLSKSETWKNWWHYYKWYVLCSVILLGIACDLAGNALGLWRPAPDFQIAYVGKEPLPEDTVNALEHAFAALGEDWDLDFNKDGKILVKINQYASCQSPDSDAPYYGTASEISLIGDISDCDSYFFLLENPDSFQREHQLLANPDGSCPDKADVSTAGKVLLWSDCPALSELELGSYSASLFGQRTAGDSQELLAAFYIGRRCFYTDAMTDNAQQCSALWELLSGNSREGDG
ncbi:MAG: hypothetical protein K2O40_14935 [Lachnospiraceae bacterium]|nr:hypothetical protein [Lachnospiraceae bacterium]